MKKTMKRAVCLLLVLTMLSTLVVYSEPATYDELEAYAGFDAFAAAVLLPNSGIKMLAAGGENSAFITNDGRLFIFGYNEQGQISTSLGTSNPYAVSTPVEIPAPAGASWSYVSVGGISYDYAPTFFGSQYAAIASDGSLWTWGWNGAGQLGINSTVNTTIPTRVNLPGETNTTWMSVSVGGVHMLGIKSDGSLWAWGGYSQGQLGVQGTAYDGANALVPVPVNTAATNWVSIAAGAYYSMALNAAGELFTWGGNAEGQLGNGNSGNTGLLTSLGTGWSSISAGLFPSLALQGSSLLSWGGNGEGELGLGTSGGNQLTPVTVPGSYNWESIAAGGYHALGIQDDGTLWSWGNYGDGALGVSGLSANQPSPIQVNSDTDWDSVEAGLYHSLAMKTDGSLWAWGKNNRGQIGNASTSNQQTPFLVVPSVAITQAPANITVVEGEITQTLTAAATVTNAVGLSYQWYSSTSNSTTGGTPISGANGTLVSGETVTLTIPTTLTQGTYYYYVVISVTTGTPAFGGATPVAFPVTSPIAAVAVAAPGTTLLDVGNLTDPSSGTGWQYSSGALTIDNGAAVSITGTLSAPLDITTPSGGTANVTVADPLTLANGANLSVGAGVTMTVPTGTNLDVSSGADLNIDSGATLINNGGGITIDSTGTLTNNGTLDNTGAVTNNGTIINDGTFNNTGTVTNNGTFTNNGAVTGDDSFLPINVSLSVSDTYDFGSVQEGADVSALQLEVTITNDGEVATGELSVGLTGQDPDSFTVDVVSAALLSISAFAFSASAVTIPSIAPGGTAAFTVTPNAGLSAGTYTATVIVSGTDINPQAFDVSLTVTSAPPLIATSIATAISDPASITAYDARNATDIAGIIALANLPSTVDVNLEDETTATLGITWSSTSTFDQLGTTYTITGAVDSATNVDVSSLTIPFVTFTVAAVTATNPTFTNTSVQVNINLTTPQTPSDLGATALPTSGSINVGVTDGTIGVSYTTEWAGTLDVTEVGNSTAFAGTITYTSPPSWLTIPGDLSVSRTVTVTDCTHDLMYELPWIVRIEPTCTTEGEAYRQCPTCGYEETQPIPALGHDYSETYTQTLAPTCTSVGKESRACLRCGDRIDERDIPALGHTWSSWTVTTAPTATTAGVETRTCTVCGATETRPIPALGTGGVSDSSVIAAPTIPEYESDNDRDAVITPQIPWNHRDRGVVIVPETPLEQTVAIVSIPASGGTSSKTGGKLDILAEKENNTVKMAPDRQTKKQLIDYAQKAANENIGQKPVVKLDLSRVENVKDIMLPKEMFDTLAQSNVGLKIALPSGSVEFSKEALESTVKQAADENISITLEKKSKAELSQTQQGAISENDMVFGIQVSSGGIAITKFDGDLIISVPYTGKLPAAIWQLKNEEAALHQQYEYGPLPAGMLQSSNSQDVVRLHMTYDPNTQTITFVTGSLTPFFVAGYIGSSSPWIRLAIGESTYTVNGMLRTMDVTPIIVDDRTMVPIRFVAEALGAYVMWDGARRAAVLELNGLTITIFIGELAPGMDIPAMIIDDRTMVPLRFISEALGAEVFWYPGTNMIDIILAFPKKITLQPAS